MSAVTPSSSHQVIVSSTDRRFVTIDRRGRKPCCLVAVAKVAINGSADFLENRLKTDLRLMGLNCLGSVVWGILQLGLLLRGTNLQGSGQFGVKYSTAGQVQGKRGS